MNFEKVLDQAIDMLYRRGRLTYRTLKRQFDLADEVLEDLKEELIYGQQVAVDEDERVLVWASEAPAPTQNPQPETDSESRLYTALPFVISLLQRERRVTYRMLKHAYGVDDGFLSQIREELMLRQIAIDEGGKVLVWQGEPALTAPPMATDPSGPAIAEPPVSRSPVAPVASIPLTAMEVGPSGPNVLLEAPIDASPAEPVTMPEPVRSVPEAERRQLTVMFCDLVGSTDLSGKLDPENLREVVRDYQETAAEVIQRYEGHIAQYLGDGLLIYFGFPVAHEDDAQRAVYTGLGIPEAMAGLNTRLEANYGVQLAVRIGIHTGPVVVGEMGGGGRHENLALGETPNIAARLEGLAEPNTAVLGPVTAQRVERTFILKDLGPHALKGVAEPMRLFSVVRPREVESDFEETTLEGFEALMGRDEEIGLILRRWEQSKEGFGQVVSISGEAGIGKSSLVDGLRHHVRQEGLLRMTYRCSPYATNSTLYPIIDHVQRVLGWQSEEPPETKLIKLEQGLKGYSLPSEHAVPLLASLLSLPLPEGRYPPLTLSAPQQRQQTQDVLVAWLLEEAERHPVLAVWEDLHWADPSTLEMLGLFVNQAPTVPMLHVLTFRPEFEPPWPPRSHLTPIALNRLERPQVEALITQLGQGKSLPEEVLEHIVSKTDGVPLFVEELTKMLLDSGLLRAESDHYVLTGPLLTVAIPDTLQDSLMARLDQLSTAKELAQLGAVLGREFSFTMLQALTAMEEEALQEGLTQLVAAELLYQRGRPPWAKYIFKHALIQDAAYASLLRSRRRELHADIARVLLENQPELAHIQPELLAYHYTQASLRELALDHWQAAAELALQRSAYVEAIQSLDQALAQLAQLAPNEGRDTRELELQVMKLGPLFPVKGYSAPECEETSARALTLCRRVGDNETLFPVLYARWATQYVRGMQGEVFDLSREYLELACAEGADAATVVGYRIHAVALLMRGEVEAAGEHARQAVELYVPERHQPLIARFGQDLKVQSLNYLALSEALSGRMDTAWTLGEESIAHARSLNHIPSLAYTLWHVGVWLPAVIRQTEFLHCFGTELLDLSREHRLGFWEAFTQAFLMVTAPQTPEALGAKEAEQALHVYQHDFHALLVVPQALCHIAEVYVTAGHGEAARRVLKEAETLMARYGEVYWEPEVYRLRGQLALMEGGDDDGVAVTEFQRALVIAQQKGLKLLELRATVSLARLWQSQGKRQEAYDLLTPVYGWFTEGFGTADLKEAKALLTELGA